MNAFFVRASVILFLSFTNACAQDSNESEKAMPLSNEQITEDTLRFSSGIRAIWEDSKGNYWFGSHQEGAARFDGETFTYFTTEDGLPHNQVRRIVEDEEGRIWFVTADGPCAIVDDEIKVFPNEITIGWGNPVLRSKPNISRPWFNAGTKNGFYSFTGEVIAFHDFPTRENYLADYPFGYNTTSFSKTNKNRCWIGTYLAVFGFDGSEFTVLDDAHPLLNVLPGMEEGLHVRSVFEDSKGNVWIGNNGIGVLLFTGETARNFSYDQGLMNANTKGGDRSPKGTMEHIFAISEDKDGNIWFGDRDTGAWKYDGEEMTNYTIDSELKSQHIWQIYEDSKGTLLVAMGNGGVYEFKGDSFIRKF